MWSSRAISACDRLPAANSRPARRRRSCMAAKSRRGAMDRVMPYSLLLHDQDCHYIMRGSVSAALIGALAPHHRLLIQAAQAPAGMSEAPATPAVLSSAVTKPTSRYQKKQQHNRARVMHSRAHLCALCDDARWADIGRPIRQAAHSPVITRKCQACSP